MRNRSSLAPLMLTMLLVLPALALCQAARRTGILVLNGQLGQVTVVQMNGQSYVDLENLRHALRMAHSAFHGNQITLTSPTSSSTPSAAPQMRQFQQVHPRRKLHLQGLPEGRRRSWSGNGTARNAIQNGFPIAESWLSGYRIHDPQAGLRLASVAASTDSDAK